MKKNLFAFLGGVFVVLVFVIIIFFVLSIKTKNNDIPGLPSPIEKIIPPTIEKIIPPIAVIDNYQDGFMGVKWGAEKVPANRVSTRFGKVKVSCEYILFEGKMVHASATCSADVFYGLADYFTEKFGKPTGVEYDRGSLYRYTFMGPDTNDGQVRVMITKISLYQCVVTISNHK